MGTVRFKNDHVAAILGFSDLQWGNMLITRVYFVKGLGHNLFLVGQFCDSDLEVAFRRNACFIKNLEGVDLLKGDRSTKLYIINLHEMASPSPICLMARASSTKSWLWHQRLSHLNFDTINDLAKNDLEHLCPSCEQGKSKRASHPPKPVPNSRQRLHILHMDLCGPMRIASINRKRYVLVIVDDYSRYTWVHFLRSKDETPEVIKTILKRINVLLHSSSSSSSIFLPYCIFCDHKVMEMIRLSWGIKSQVGSKSHPPMLNKESYVPWSSRLLWYAKSRPNGKLIYNSILNGPYVRKMIPEPGDANREITVTETFHLQTDDELTDKEFKQIEADDQAIQTILLGLPEDIYATVDSCETAQEIWLRTQDPLALMANSNNPYVFSKHHQDQSSFNQNYLQQPMKNPEDITDPTTAMNMPLVLMAKAFKLNYSTPTNNNQMISSNPRNMQIAQPGMNMGQDRQMQMVGGNGGNQFRQYAGQNAGNLAGYNDVIRNQVIQNAIQNPRVQNVGNQNGLIGV
nr:retrovirus-related Pol polyprotein from transposon TNT 1-94 [Tanacetum cinerariifolium]